jgi:hypothetical protein
MNPLEAYIREMLSELRANERMLALLRGSGIRGAGSSNNWQPGAWRVASLWIRDAEAERGKPLSPKTKGVINKFVGQRWNSLLKRFHGDEDAAETTMNNLLDSRFNSTRIGE